MNRRIQSIFVLLVLLSLLLGGCGRKGKTPSDTDTAAPSADTQEVRDAFDEFTDELFAEVVSTDALTLHYELADPSLYDIKLDSIDLGIIDAAYDSSVAETEDDEYRRLQEFPYESLTNSQQVTYDLLDEYYRTSEEIFLLFRASHRSFRPAFPASHPDGGVLLL